MQCKLCQKERKLCKSHIIPKFFFRRMKDEKGRMLFIPTSEDSSVQYKQDGVYEKMLCHDCEAYLSAFERRASGVFYKNMEYFDTDAQNKIRVVNLEYKEFKLFQLSVLWKAGVAKNRFFNNVRLGPHLEIIRKMLIEKDPGAPHEYGCIMVGLTDPDIPFRVVMMPERGRDGAHTMYRFTFGCCLWLYVVSSHSKSFEKKEYFLQKDGSMLFLSYPAKEVPFIRAMAKELVAVGKGNSPDS